MTATQVLLGADPAAWRDATTSPFLGGAKDGTLEPAAFDRWLEQDHAFVVALVRAWGRVLARAPRQDFSLLVEGIASLVDELEWFEGVAADRDLRLGGPDLPATRAYTRALTDLSGRSYPVAITAMWAVEAAYLTAWRSALPGAPAYAEFVGHWANEEFAAFVDRLAEVVDREQGDAPSAEAQAAFAEVLALEAIFWTMTLTG